MPRPQLALFDCDGTLIDSQHAIVAAMSAAWRSDGMEPPPSAAIRQVVGLSLIEAIAVLLPDAPYERCFMLGERYKQAFGEARRRGAYPEPLYPNVREALDDLSAHGVLLGIATGKSRRGLLTALDAHGLRDRFVTLHTADDGPSKPHPDMTLQALANTGVEARDAVVIGDTSYDMMMAANANVTALGVAWGYHDAMTLQANGAQRVLKNANELPSAVLSSFPP
ncbi:phosphoglycolate phosphatase [Azospirillaceae bacterium]